MACMVPFISERTRDIIVDILIYTCFISIIIWAILKALGVFNTPVWVEIMPMVWGSFGALLVVFKFGNAFGVLKQDVVHLKLDSVQLKQDMKEVKHGLGVVEKKTDKLEFKFDHLEKDIEFVKEKSK